MYQTFKYYRDAKCKGNLVCEMIGCFIVFNPIGVLHELDPNLYWAGSQGGGFRNIANDPEYIERANKAMYEACIEMRERRHRHAIYSIKQQPFYK